MDPVKGSRFVATVAPTVSEDDAVKVLAEVRSEWPGATHHCWAWRLSDGRTRSSDDGEPGGSAGRPILARLRGKDIEDAVVVVTRWYGGTKLGVGGLIRAYGGCAGMALDRADIIEIVRTIAVGVVFEYADTGAVQRVLADMSLAPTDQGYGAQVSLSLAVPTEATEALERALRDATGGRAQITVE
jgi:uncharacterized YigZ family protein